MTIRARYPRVYRYKMITTALNAITRLLQDKVLRKEKVVVCAQGAAPLKLGFPRQERNPWPSLPRLRSVVVVCFVVDA